MDFFTPVELPSGLPPLVQADSLLLMGSCFATNMGSLLADAKFHPDINPFGVLYNPLSISAALREVQARYIRKKICFSSVNAGIAPCIMEIFLHPQWRKLCSASIPAWWRHTNAFITWIV